MHNFSREELEKNGYNRFFILGTLQLLRNERVNFGRRPAFKAVVDLIYITHTQAHVLVVISLSLSFSLVHFFAFLYTCLYMSIEKESKQNAVRIAAAYGF